MQMLKWDFMRDTGACLAPASVQQLCVGLETLARGLNTMLTFGLRGGEAEMENMGVYAGFLRLSVGSSTLTTSRGISSGRLKGLPLRMGGADGCNGKANGH